MATAFGYTRVSTSQQEGTPESQAQRCEDYYRTWLAKSYEWGGIFHDHGVSATKVQWQERPKGRELLQQVTRGDIIITPMADRLFRSVVDQGKSLEFLESLGIKLAILNCNVDTSTPVGEFALTLMTATGRMESVLKAERNKMFMAGRKQKKAPRKAHPPAGWYYSQKKGDLFPDYTERKLLEQAFLWNDAGVQSIKKTCAWLREEDIKRRCGARYLSSWVYQARPLMESGWPLEGYTRAWWRERGEDYREQRKERLAKVKKRAKDAKKASVSLRYMRPENLRALLTGDPVDPTITDAGKLYSTQPADPSDT
jgi:DNA invertase Pin-like site-specific DNA recombinase